MSEAISQLAKSIVSKISNRNNIKIRKAKANILNTVKNETVNEAVYDALGVNLELLPTREYISEYVENHFPSEVDVTDFATVEYVDSNIPDMTLYSTTEEIQDMIANIDLSDTNISELLNDKADVDNVYTKNEIDNLLESKVSAEDVYNKDELYTNAELYTKDEISSLLNEKANEEFVYSKTEMDNLLDEKADAEST